MLIQYRKKIINLKEDSKIAKIIQRGIDSKPIIDGEKLEVFQSIPESTMFIFSHDDWKSIMHYTKNMNMTMNIHIKKYLKLIHENNFVYAYIEYANGACELAAFTHEAIAQDTQKYEDNKYLPCEFHGSRFWIMSSTSYGKISVKGLLNQPTFDKEKDRIFLYERFAPGNYVWGTSDIKKIKNYFLEKKIKISIIHKENYVYIYQVYLNNRYIPLFYTHRVIWDYEK